MSLSSDRRQRVDDICDAALELPTAAREAYVLDACAGDLELKAEVESLLAQASAADQFLNAPVGALAAVVVNDAAGAIIEHGTTLGTYQVVEPLGSGGEGRVFRARDTELRRDVALKVLTGYSEGDAARASLLREARRAAQLSHPSICHVFHVGDSPHGPFMVMELVDGQTLRDLLRAGPLPAADACRLGADIARALEHAHGHGLVHRDLKSANVMLTRDGQLKVLDFGIATILNDADHEPSPGSRRATHVSGIAGTVPYMAPEVLSGAPASAASDIWALGVVIYEMVAGRLPFDGATSSKLIASIQHGAGPPVPRGVPRGLARVIRHCLAKKSSDRPAHAADVARALDAIRDGTNRRPRWQWWGVASSAVAVMSLVALTYFTRLADNQSATGFDNPLQVTTAVGVEEFPALSPDGQTLAYSASSIGVFTGNPDWDVWVVRPRGGTPVNRTVDHRGRDLFPSWSPDGSQIAFWSDREGAGCYVMPAQGGMARRVAAASDINPNPPQWSEDGNEIGCVVGDAIDVRLNVVSVDTGGVLRRINLPGEGRRLFVTWRRDTQRVAYVTSTAGLESDLTKLILLDVRSGQTRELTDGQSKVWSPGWLADGTLYYVARSGATMDLWQQRFSENEEPVGGPRVLTAGVGMRNAAYSRDGRKLAYSQGRKVANVWRVPFRSDRTSTWADAEQITFDQAFIECVDVNKSGTALAISSDRAGTFDLWTLPSRGGEMRQLTADASAEWCPAWSPDESTLAFYAYRTGDREIWTVPVQGGEWRRITGYAGPDLHPSWSHDGRTIVHGTRRAQGPVGWATTIDGGAGKAIVSGPTLRWSPIDSKLAFLDAGRLWVKDTATDTAPRALVTTGAGEMRWTPDGRDLLYRLSQYKIAIVGADTKADERLLLDLSGRRGALSDRGAPTDGRFVYFIWTEDLGDVWVMDVVSSPR